MVQCWVKKTPVERWKKANDQTDESIARLLRVARETWNKWLNGRDPIPLAWAHLLCLITGLTYGTLFTETVVEPPQPRAKADVLAKKREGVA